MCDSCQFLLYSKQYSSKSRETRVGILSPAMGRGIDSRNRVWNLVAKLDRLAGRYDNSTPTWFLAPIDGLTGTDLLKGKCKDDLSCTHLQLSLPTAHIGRRMTDSMELVFCRQHEAPGGLYATGIITRTYRQVSSGHKVLYI